MAASSLGVGLGGHTYTYLPYPQAACREIEHHLVSLAAAFPSCFEATLSPFTHDDGRDAILVNAAGALPATGSEVSLWLVEAYPHAPPIVFMPLSSGAGTPRPAYVDGSGAVAAPYLRHWRWPDSDLVGLVQSLDVLVGMHHRQPPEPTDDSASACAVRRRRDAGADDAQRALRALQDDRDRLEQELRLVSMREAELLDAIAAERRAAESEAAEDALDRALLAGRLPLCEYLKGIKDVARTRFMAWPVPDDLLSPPEHKSNTIR